MKKTVALLLCVGLILGAPYPRAANAANTLTRQLDPVVVLGSAMPDFAGVPLAHLFVYKYSGGAWSQIPWQFDEIDAISGLIVPLGNGLLDAQDQLVFMAADAGDQAPAHAWLSDASAATYPRYELQVNDPLNTSQHAWVYVYRSQTLPPAIATDYVTYDAAQVLLISDHYQLGQLATQPAFDRLKLNGSGVDILDRTKIRVYVLFLPFTEDSQQLATTPPVLTRAGRVRVVLNGGGILAYRSFYVNKIHVETTLTPQSGRFSSDMSSLASGSIYYDPNTPSTGVTIDGVPDTLTKSPAAVWSLVKVKTSAGFIGAIVRAIDFSGAISTPTQAKTFYRDNVTPESSDTGEPGSYGDAGVEVTSPKQVFDFWSWNYILSSSELEPDLKVQGDKYNGYARNPLQVQATENQPFMMSTVTIGRSGASDVVLGWQTVNGADFYRVWYDPQPYFIPSGASAPDPNNSDLNFTHVIAPADLANYYYVVRAVDTVGSDNFESTNSNRTGRFTFTLVPGTG